MSQDSEELSEVFEEEEDVGIKQVYVSKQIMTISKKIEQKHLEDDDDEPDLGSESDQGSAVEEAKASDESDHYEDQVPERQPEKHASKTISPPVFFPCTHSFHRNEPEPS